MSTDTDKLKEVVSKQKIATVRDNCKRAVESGERVFAPCTATFVLALIADLEEAKVHWAHKGLRLATAEKLIEAQHEALKVCEAALDVLGITVCGEPVPEAVVTAWEDAEEVCVSILALYEAYKKEK